MIVDTHVYCFRAPDQPAGAAAAAEHLGYWQWGYALHHQPAIRTRDHAHLFGPDRALLDPTPDDEFRRATNRWPGSSGPSRTCSRVSPLERTGAR
jgi:hypothetical protein